MKFTTTLAQLKKSLNAKYTDGAFTAPNALVSATATFVAGDVGKAIVASQGVLKPGTTIASRTNATTVVLVHSSGTAVQTGGPFTGVTFTIAGRDRATIDVPLITLPPASVVKSVVDNASAKVTSQHDFTFTDGVFNSTTTVTSATAAFVAADQGKTVTGAGIPADTTIASITNGTTIVLSAATTTTGSGKTVVIVNREKLTAATMRVMSANNSYGTAKSALVANSLDADFTPKAENYTTTTPLFLRVAVTGDNLSGLTGGSIDSWIDYDVLK